jgi:hypothetical protein
VPCKDLRKNPEIGNKKSEMCQGEFTEESDAERRGEVVEAGSDGQARRKRFKLADRFYLWCLKYSTCLRRFSASFLVL